MQNIIIHFFAANGISDAEKKRSAAIDLQIAAEFRTPNMGGNHCCYGQPAMGCSCGDTGSATACSS
jgi:hypothetical protein